MVTSPDLLKDLMRPDVTSDFDSIFLLVLVLLQYHNLVLFLSLIHHISSIVLHVCMSTWIVEHS